MELNSRLLEGRVVFITGSNRGIGLSIVEKFAEQGAIVYANSRTEGSLDELSKDLSVKYSTKVIPLYFDVCDITAMKNAFMTINQEQKRLDCVINNAGIMHDAVIGMITDASMIKTFSINVFAPIHILQFASKFMKRQKFGSIINISSIVGCYGSSGQLVYSASKGAIISMTKSASKELASYNIRVNAIAPGLINTELLNSLGAVKLSEAKSKIGMNRLGSVEDVANTALFLASDLSEYVTGQVIGVDGSTVM